MVFISLKATVTSDLLNVNLLKILLFTNKWHYLYNLFIQVFHFILYNENCSQNFLFTEIHNLNFN